LRFREYGKNPYEISKCLSGKICARTIYNYIDGTTKPNKENCNLIISQLRIKYARLYKLVVEELKEEGRFGVLDALF